MKKWLEEQKTLIIILVITVITVISISAEYSCAVGSSAKDRILQNIRNRYRIFIKKFEFNFQKSANLRKSLI